MPIVTLQRQMRELGRIRTGVQVASADGKKRRPAKLETFRLTSASRDLIEAAAEAYGGTVKPWQNGEHAEFEVVTDTAVLDIIIPPGQPVSQWNEMWAGGGCLRRCDGVTEVLTMQPCLCPADVPTRIALAAKGEACKETTRLSVMLPALPDLGVWRMESHGHYAAVELAGAADVLVFAQATGRLLPARLRLQQRKKLIPGQPTLKYAVPIIEFVETRIADLPLLAAGEAPRSLPPARPSVPALPATTLPERSDFRAPQPVGAPLSESIVESAPDSAGSAVTAARPVARDAGALCGAPAQPPLFTDGETCGLALEHAGQHRVLGPGGIVQGSWPA